MAALAIGLGGAIGELWVQDGLLLLLALGLSSFAGYRLYIKNNSEKKLQDAILADERAIDLACRFGYSVPNAYKSLGGALKELIEKTEKEKSFFEDRLDALRKSAEKLDQNFHNKKVLENQFQVKMYMDNKSLVLMAAKACDEKKAKDIKLIKIDKVSFISEWILIAEGLSDVQVRSITNSVEGELRDKAKIEPIRKEGLNEAKWALLDYGDLIVNIFQPDIRKYYDLESFWSNGDNLQFP